MVRIARTGAACTPRYLGVRRRQLTSATSWLHLARCLAMSCGILVLVGPARYARTSLSCAVWRDFLPRSTIRLCNTGAIGQEISFVARSTRRAPVRWARGARCHVAVCARRALLKLALAVACGCLVHRLILCIRARRVRCTCAAAIMRERWCNLHVLHARAHIYR